MLRPPSEFRSGFPNLIPFQFIPIPIPILFLIPFQFCTKDLLNFKFIVLVYKAAMYFFIVENISVI